MTEQRPNAACGAAPLPGTLNRVLPASLCHPAERAARLLGILLVLCDGPIALSALKRCLHQPCEQTLCSDLAALEDAWLVKRTPWSARTLKWSYELTGQGEAVRREVRRLASCAAFPGAP